MSSTNRGAVRDLDDYYATPPQLAALICKRLAVDLSDDPRDVVNVLEPGCGGGSFLVAARDAWPRAHILGLEINAPLAAKARAKGFEVQETDVLTADLPGDFHVIVGNPPFKHAESFINRLLPRLDPQHGYLAFLLRLNFLGGQDRYRSLWRRHVPERIYLLPARPGFTPDGKSDSIEYMVAVWRHPDIQTDATRLLYLDNTGIANKWFAGTYEDPRGLWFPPEPAAPVTEGASA